MDDLISRLSEIRSRYNCFDEAEEPYYRALSEAIKMLSERKASNLLQDLPTSPLLVHKMPSAQPEWNNHTIACLLAELFNDTCACNYNDIDEWLPEKCELLDSCPNPVGVACWEQFLKHKAEVRE